MKTIGLVRHYEVIQEQPRKKWMTSLEFDAWVRAYDDCDVIRTPSTINSSDWDFCMSSDLSRAVITANHMYDKEIIYTDQLREIRIKSFFSTKLKLHYSLWLIIGRISYSLFHKLQPEGKQEIIQRIRDVIDQLEKLNLSKVLVVSHGALMWYIRKELRKRRYKGPLFIKPKNGKLYTYHSLPEVRNMDG